MVDQENTIITFILGDDERYYKNQSKINLTLTRDGLILERRRYWNTSTKVHFFQQSFLNFEDLGYKNKQENDS